MNETFQFDYSTFYKFYEERAEKMKLDIVVYFLTRSGFKMKELTHTYRIAPQIHGQKPLRVWLEFSEDKVNKFVYIICPNQTHPKMKYGDHFTLGLKNEDVMLHRTLYEGSHCRIKGKNAEWCKFKDGMEMDKNIKVFDFTCLGENGKTLQQAFDKDDQMYLNSEGISMILKEPFIGMTDDRMSYDDPKIYDTENWQLLTECTQQGGKGSKLTSKEKKIIGDKLQQLMKSQKLEQLIAVVDKTQDRVELFTTQSS